MNIIEAIEDQNLFAPWFRDKKTWRAWRAFLCTLFALPLDRDAQKIYQQCTQRPTLPKQRFNESWLVVGRRGGKSFISALVAVFIACFGDFKQYLTPGEVGTVMLIAADRKQSRILMRYISALLNQIPLLKSLIANEARESIELTNGITIEVATCSFRTVRGYSIVCCVADEVAFWRTDDGAANPDKEILDAIRPAMATIPNSLLIAVSSPHAKRGVLYESYQRHFGKNSDVLVWQAASKLMNPTLAQSVIDRAIENDPDSAKAEYMALFRSDIEQFISREAVQQCVVPDRIELPAVPGVRYQGFCDPSGGSSDSMTFAIAHEEGKTKVLDLIREYRPPFNPDEVVREISELCKSYWLGKISGDRFGGIWPQSKFQEHGVRYEIAQKTKNDIYSELLPVINSCSCELLDIKKLHTQLTSLERITSKGAKDRIDHPRGQHDDLINAAAGAIVGGIPRSRAGTWGTR